MPERKHIYQAVGVLQRNHVNKSDVGLDQLKMVPYILFSEERRNDNGVRPEIGKSCVSRQVLRRRTVTDVGPRSPGSISQLLNSHRGPSQSAVEASSFIKRIFSGLLHRESLRPGRKDRSVINIRWR